MHRQPLRIALDAALGEARKQARACDPRLYSTPTPGTTQWADAAARAATWEAIAIVLESTEASPTAVHRALVVLELHAIASRWDDHHIRTVVMRRLMRALDA